MLLNTQAYGFYGFILDWMKDFLSEREQRVILGNISSDWIMVTSGVPQGSALGPLLFFIYIKASREIGILRNSFKSLDLISLGLVYCSLVRPHLDYAVSGIHTLRRTLIY